MSWVKPNEFNKLTDIEKKNLLEELYLKQEKSTNEIEHIIHKNNRTISYYLKKYQIPIRTKKDAMLLKFKYGLIIKHAKGDKSPSWKGGRRISSTGYVEINDFKNPYRRANGYIYEHRLIWQKYYGEIPPGCIIHHINGIKTDNRIENLRLMETKEHSKFIASQDKIIKKLQEEIIRLKQKLGED